MATNSILILPYQSSWPTDFLNIKEVLLQKIAAPDVVIEHVGSTAVPHLAAKPIIDIDIAYMSFDTYELIKNGLETLGYYHNGNQGIEGREVFKRKMVTINHPILDSITHHVYVCHNDNDEYKRHIIFRDYLRKNETARDEYQVIKLEIARKANHDKKTYALLKEIEATEFIEGIIEKSQS
jgi:GrpB-like predicted nucleotidyltransferase (UPF0157 family)